MSDAHPLLIDDSITSTRDTALDTPVPVTSRKRPKPGERRVQILQALAGMLEHPNGERITTASLAARLEVSEAALYRHFASKAQMFEGLIDFIEQSVFTLVNQIVLREAGQSEVSHGLGLRQAATIVAMLLQFAEKNPGMARVMVGDALVFENERLHARMNQFFDKVEASLKQCLRTEAVDQDAKAPKVDAALRASVLVSFSMGRLQRFVRSGFKRLPTEKLDASLHLMLG